MGIKPLTDDLVRAAQNGFKSLYLKDYKAASESPWRALFTTYSDAGEIEIYTALGAVAQLKAWTGSREFTTRSADGVQVISKEYDVAYAVDMMDAQRDKLGRHAGWFQAAGKRAATYMFPLVAAVLANGTNLAYSRCWDGKPLFSITHGKRKGTSQSNIITGAGADTLANVQLDIAKANAAGRTFQDDQGEYIEGIAYNTVIYPAANYTLGKILDIIKQKRQALDQPDQSQYVDTIIPSPRITGNTYYLAAGGGLERPFGWQEEMAPTLEQSSDFGTRKMLSAIHASGQAFASDWRTIIQISNAG